MQASESMTHLFYFPEDTRVEIMVVGVLEVGLGLMVLECLPEGVTQGNGWKAVFLGMHALLLLSRHHLNR